MTEAQLQLTKAAQTAPVPELQTLPEIAPVTATTPMAMLDKALTAGAEPEFLDKLLGLIATVEERAAVKAFNNAIADAKAEIPAIPTNRQGHNGRYADFEALATVVDPILSEHGLNYRFRTEQDDKLIKVTCILSHRDGHSEENTLAGPPDTSGSKNAIQAIGSSTQYLMRYTLKQGLGLAVAHDDDGQSAGRNTAAISEDQLTELQSLISDTEADIPRFCRYFRIEALPDLPASKFDAAIKMLNRKAGQ